MASSRTPLPVPISMIAKRTELGAPVTALVRRSSETEALWWAL